ncbi:2-C-methyl-D-erythritol 4-phosphate cytidylyltransferase [Gordonia rhizosphera NBRC 16068]|uniref:2-C-methyl-D-erythritol 4-phosphate cytidylyltransferase n=1 Tax=Gordonia rhizosphera NBRC 16068 TaxID=1108045 RepID=K6WHS3_9ACTN|nr:2-C-methyl-D-erythritol 4-phosphate cytidylyltransferase [Gordonia rhizosphera NBRC 16068]
MTVSVIVPAAGSGTRLGQSKPKAFVDLGGRTILEACVAGIVEAAVADTVVVVVPADLVDDARRLVPATTVVAGGAHRSESVRAGIDAAGPDSDILLVHDAARPLTPPAVFTRVVDAVRAGHPAVVPGLPVADTLKQVDPSTGPERVVATVDRDLLRAIQTPQGFARDALLRAHADDTGLATDDAGLAERCGIEVHVVPGDPLAMKITTPWDLRIARDIVAEGSPSAGPVPSAGRVVDERSSPAGRVASERSEPAYRDHSSADRDRDHPLEHRRHP